MNITWILVTPEMVWDPHNFGPLDGFIQPGMRWNNYLSRWPTDVQPRVEALRSDILACGVFRGGDWHQDPDHTGIPRFEDGMFFYDFMRALGDLMAAIWSTIDDVDYGYCDFAWGVPDREYCRTQKLISFKDIIAGIQARMLAEFTAKREPANDDDPFEGEFQSKVAEGKRWGNHGPVESPDRRRTAAAGAAVPAGACLRCPPQQPLGHARHVD